MMVKMCYDVKQFIMTLRIRDDVNKVRHDVKKF